MVVKRLILCIFLSFASNAFTDQSFFIDGKYFYTFRPDYFDDLLCELNCLGTYNGVLDRYLYRHYYDDRPDEIYDETHLSIRNETIYIDSINICYFLSSETQRIPLSLIWPNSNGPIEVNWFSDTLRLKKLRYKGDKGEQYIIVFKNGKVMKMGKRVCRDSISNCEQDSIFSQLDDFDSNEKLEASIHPCLIFFDNFHKYDSCETLRPTEEEMRIADSLEEEKRKKLPRLYPLYKPFIDSLIHKVRN